MQLVFYKYQGTGNDFILADNRGKNINLPEADVHRLCDRRFGIGADGLMLLNEKEGFDFEMKYYNADGREGSMCGNGGRCIVKFAQQLGIHKEKYHFIATDGPHDATIDNKGIVSLKMKEVSEVTAYHNDLVLNTGSPHYIQMAQDVMALDVVNSGKAIRYNNDFNKEGINVNFVEKKDEDHIIVRTYERGVEDETYSCGTGVTAAAIAFRQHEPGNHIITVKTIGGDIRVSFNKNIDGSFDDIWLTGPAEMVYSGAISLDR